MTVEMIDWHLKQCYYKAMERIIILSEIEKGGLDETEKKVLQSSLQKTSPFSDIKAEFGNWMDLFLKKEVEYGRVC